MSRGTAGYDAILNTMGQFLPKLVLGAALALPIGGLAEAADLGRGRSIPDFGLSRATGRARGPDLRARETRRLDLQRRTREVQRDVRRLREERRIEHSGTRQDLERYQRKERVKDATSDLSHNLDQPLIDSRAGGSPSTDRETRFLDLQRDIERSLRKVKFERRQRRLEHELRWKSERSRLETGDP